jgi:hypothetical protein
LFLSHLTPLGYFFGGMGNYSQGGLFASLNLSFIQEGIKNESTTGLPLLNQYIYSSCALGPIQMNTTFFVFGGSNESTYTFYSTFFYQY